MSRSCCEFEDRRTEKDPVCGLKVDPLIAAATCVHEAKTYCFCSLTCKSDFLLAPSKYLPTKVFMRAQVYSCPGHSEVLQATAGLCPLCGGSLVLVNAQKNGGGFWGKLKGWASRVGKLLSCRVDRKSKSSEKTIG